MTTTAIRPRYDPQTWATYPTGTMPGWIQFLVRLIQEAHAKKKTGRRSLYQKPIQYLGRSAHVFKSRDSRLRIVLQQGPGGPTDPIDAYVSIPTPAKPGSPYLPRFPQHGDPRIHHTQWTFDEAGLLGLFRACLDWLEEQTCYQEPDYYRVPLSTDITRGFMFGKIVKSTFLTHHPQTQEPVGMWALDIQEGFISAEVTPSVPVKLPQTYWVRADAITFYNAVALGYILVYHHEGAADVAGVGDVHAFCQLL